LSGLGDAQYARARMLSGLEYFRRCVSLCESAGLVKLDIANRCMMGHCSYYANQLTEAVAHIRRAGDEARRTGHAYGEIFAQESIGMLLASSGHDAEAQREIERVMPLARRADARRYLIALLWSLAMTRLASGEDDAARAHLEEAQSFNDQTGNSFFGAILWGGIARAARSYDQAQAALKRGEALLREPCLSHCHLQFYRDAIEVSLDAQAWAEALRYAGALESYTSAEPLPWALLVIQRARALAAIGSGKHTDAVFTSLRQLRAELVRVGMLNALSGVDLALAAA